MLFFIIRLIHVGGVAESFPQESEVNSDVHTEEDNNPVHAVTDSVLSYFYPVSGVILGFEKGLAKVEFMTGRKLKRGMRFSVFRKGRPFFHPVTKEPIGKTEEFTGRIEIKEREDELYLCRVVNGSPEVGDLVRITSSKLKLAFFQDRNAEWTLSEMFYNSLKDSGRFNFLESYTKTYEPEELSRLARGLGAEVVLLFSTPAKEENMFVNVKLFWAEDAVAFAEIEHMMGQSLVRELMHEEEKVPIGSPGGEPWASYKLAGGEFIATGDVDGNGERELVVGDDTSIRIYNYQDEPREIWFIKGSPQERILSIDVLDVNNNGRAEIFVTSLRGESIMSSYVLEYDPTGGYKRIWDKVSYILRVVDESLLMQRFTPFKTFTGPVYTGVWREGRYETGNVLELPEGVNIYGFTYVDWQGSGHPHVFAFDDNGYLNLYSGRELIWRSEESYGKFEISFEKKSYSVVDPEEKWFVRGRLASVKTNQGQKVIVVKKIPFVSKVPGVGYRKAEVYSFWWDREVMNETLVLGGVKGRVTDYWVENNNLLLISRPNIFMFLEKSLSGDFIKGSTLYYYNLTGK